MRASLAAGAAAAVLALVVVALTTGIGGDSGAGTGVGEQSGRAVFVRMGCGGCHTLAAAGSTGSMGPNLDARLARHTRASLVAQITAPSSAAGGFSVMPDNFGSRMDARELDALVRFMLAARSGPTNPAQ